MNVIKTAWTVYSYNEGAITDKRNISFTSMTSIMNKISFILQFSIYIRFFRPTKFGSVLCVH
jgi:hypothetical protein